MSPPLADDPTATQRRKWGRRSIAGAVCLMIVVVASIGLVLTRSNGDAETADFQTAGEVSLDGTGPTLQFRNTTIGDAYGHLAMVAATDPTSARVVTDLQCERVHYRDGHGICLRANRGADTTYDAVLFDDAFAFGDRNPPRRRAHTSPRVARR